MLGGQLAVSVMGAFGQTSTSIAGTLTAVGPNGGAASRMGSISELLMGFALSPMVTLKWHDGVHNWMTYATGDIPVGAYDPGRISSIGIGHGAIDGGGGLHLPRPDNGTRIFWRRRLYLQLQEIPIPGFRAASIFISTGVRLSFFRSSCLLVVGYAYQQVSDDTGGAAILGGFRSRVLGVGPRSGIFSRLGTCRAI